MDAITQMLTAIEQGDAHAAGQLLPLVYDELRRLAAHRLVGEGPGHTLQPTALVHEAYLKLVGADPQQPLEWTNSLLRGGGRGHAPDPHRPRPPEAPRPSRRRDAACRA